jgi:hypothetical protein
MQSAQADRAVVASRITPKPARVRPVRGMTGAVTGRRARKVSARRPSVPTYYRTAATHDARWDK